MSKHQTVGQIIEFLKKYSSTAEIKFATGHDGKAKSWLSDYPSGGWGVEDSQAKVVWVDIGGAGD